MMGACLPTVIDAARRTFEIESQRRDGQSPGVFRMAETCCPAAISALGRMACPPTSSPCGGHEIGALSQERRIALLVGPGLSRAFRRFH